MDLTLVEEFGKLLGGWTDVWRGRHPGVREWSWVQPWGRHVGYRLDHALVSPALLPRVADVRYSHAERESGVSDHSSLLLELTDAWDAPAGVASHRAATAGEGARCFGTQMFHDACKIPRTTPSTG